MMIVLQSFAIRLKITVMLFKELEPSYRSRKLESSRADIAFGFYFLPLAKGLVETRGERDRT
jgi:hypothetical protein